MAEHKCIHEDKFEDLEKRTDKLERNQPVFFKMFSDIKDEISKLRNDLNLNKATNGVQDDKLEKIEQEKQVKQQNAENRKRDIFKTISGFLLGILSAVIIYIFL